MHDSGNWEPIAPNGVEPPWDHRTATIGVALLAGVFAAAMGLTAVLDRALDDTGVAVLAATSALQLGMLAIAVRLGPGRLSGFAALLGPRRLGTLRLFGWGAAALIAIVVANAAFTSVAGLVSDRLVPPPIPDELDVDRLRLLTFVSVVLAGPFVEEVFFRGFLFAGFARVLGVWPAALLSSAAFAAVHVDVALLGPAFIAGVVFALVCRRTGSLWAAILAHTAQNTIAFGLAT